MEKTALRSHALALRKKLPLGEISQKIVAHILESQAYQEASALFVYYSTEEEIDTRSLIKQAFLDKKQVYIPKILNKGHMTLSLITADTALHQNRFGIFEADEQQSITAETSSMLAIVPCLMADKNGYRLGYGGGFYDRFLENFSGQSMVLCPGALVGDAAPKMAYDRACTMLVTEGGLVRCLPTSSPF